MPKKFFLFFMVVLISGFTLSACGSGVNNNQNNQDLNLNSSVPSTVPSPAPTFNPQESVVTLSTSKGNITLKLYYQETPNTALNFINKVKTGFYKNLIFHRVEPGFVIQGGDPTGTGTGGGNIKSELNNLPFKIGSLGLARTPQTPEISNDSQFFICLSTEVCSQLTGQYVNFGEVVSGMDVVQKISINDKILDVVINK